MLNLKTVFRLVLPMVAFLMLSIAFCPAADLHNGAATTQTTVLPATEEKPTGQAQATAQPEPKKKSVLDEEVLDSPFLLLKDAFSASEEDSDVTTQPSTLVLTVKALIATLLSTII